MVRIILIRHGETQWNIEGRYQGQEDTHLSERGLKQGHMVAEGLKDTPIDVAISSPLERSYMTCSFCADLHGVPPLMITSGNTTARRSSSPLMMPSTRPSSAISWVWI